MLKIWRLGGAMVLLTILSAIGYSQSSIMLWNAGPNLQFPRDSGAAVSTGNTIYMFGGNTTLPNSVETLAPGASVWTNSAALQTPRIGACAYFSGIIGVVGGKDGRRAIRDLTNYNPVGQSLNVKSLLAGRYLQACALDSFGRINAIGGKDVAEAPTATGEVFSGRAWTQIAPLPETRFNFSAASDGQGNILTFGGTTPTGKRACVALVGLMTMQRAVDKTTVGAALMQAFGTAIGVQIIDRLGH